MLSLALCTLVAAAIAFVGWRGSWLVLPEACRMERLLAAGTLAPAFALAFVAALAWMNALSQGTVMATAGAGAGALALLSRGRTATTMALPSDGPGPSLWWAGALAGCVLLLAGAAAFILPVWQWDSLGYHLPFVNFVLQAGGYAGLPPLIPYLSTYPHGVEHLFLIFRVFLPNDDLIDFGQIPLGALGALATAGLAQRLGARARQALVAGACWLALPAVFLQLPTNYVDVGVAAYFLLAAFWLLTPAASARHLWLGALALGLFLGAKPSAPLPTLLLGLLLAVRLWRTAGWRQVPFAAALVFAFGGGTYLDNWLATGNPVWPIAVDLGPLHLPGNRNVEKLVAAGAAAPRPQGEFFARLWSSWTTLHGPPAFDMRLGGLGPAFLFFALPGLLVQLWGCMRAKQPALVPLVVCLAAALAHPEPSTPRFVLAFPAMALACATSALQGLTRRVSEGTLILVCALAAWGLWRAVPGLTIGADRSLWQIASLPPEERRNAIGPEGSPEAWRRLTASLSAKHVIAYDEGFTLPGLLWNETLGNQVLALPRHLEADALLALLEARDVTHLVAGNALPAGQLVRARPSRFERLFACKSDPCAVYRLRREQP